MSHRSPESPDDEEAAAHAPLVNYGAAVLLTSGNANGSPVILQASTPDRARRWVRGRGTEGVHRVWDMAQW
jgi:hypothetical protein